MTTAKPLSWPLALGLGALALVRPLVRIIEHQRGVDSPAAVPIAITIGVTVVWVAVVGFSRTADPVPTLAVAGIVYGVLAIVLSGILSPILDGRLEGPLANPIAILPVLMINAGWGLVAGLLALAVQRRRLP